MKAYLDRCQNHTSVSMLELRNNTFTDVLAFPIIHRFVARQRVQDRYTAPFRTLVQRNEEFGKYRARNYEDLLVRTSCCGRVVDVCESCNGVCDNL